MNYYVCEPPDTPETSSEVPDDASLAQVHTNKLWDKYVLHVYFLNPEKLDNVRLNDQNIIDWANLWRKSRDNAIQKFEQTETIEPIPEFKQTEDVGIADIRVVVGKFID